MFLRQFHYLTALEKEAHFGRAAERCHVSQPSLSSAIKSLEEELGIPIILRHQKFQGFTEEGKRVIKWSKRLLADRAAMMEELAIMQENLKGHLRIGAMPMSSPVLPEMSRIFSERYPGVQIDIQFLGEDQLTLGLMNFELDVGISYLDQKLPARIDTMPLYEEPFHLLLPDNDWLLDKKTVSWQDAAELPLCLLSPFMHERQLMDAAFKTVGHTPMPLLQSNSIFQLAFHVMAGEIATIVPQRFTQLPGTRGRLLEEPIVSQRLGLMWVKGDPQFPMTRAFVELMEESVAQNSFPEPN